MALVARELNVAARPLDVARRLAGRPGLAFLWSADGTGPSYVASDPVAISTDLVPPPVPQLAHSALGDVPAWIGLLPYEAFRGQERPAWRSRAETRSEPWLSSPLWHRYDAVVRVGERVHVVGESQPAVERLCEALLAPPAAPGFIACEALPLEDTDEDHAARVAQAIQLIRAGELYQVNLARRLRYRVQGHPLDVLAAMSTHAPGAFSCLLRTSTADVVSTSPELLLERTPAGLLHTGPIKGTRPRGAHAADDRRQRRELDTDAKEIAELAMVVDVERNDMGRVCLAGSVRVTQMPRVDVMSGVFHRWARVSGRERPGLPSEELFAKLLPSGSVTGAPKVRAMEVIADLERERRGLYTGGVGMLSRAGGIVLAMAIRTLVRRGTEAEYFVGGGIVADSDPQREVVETHWKAQQVSRLIRGAPLR